MGRRQLGAEVLLARTLEAGVMAVTANVACEPSHGVCPQAARRRDRVERDAVPALDGAQPPRAVLGVEKIIDPVGTRDEPVAPSSTRSAR